MTFKNYEIYSIAEGLLRNFSAADATQKLPIKLSFAIKKNTTKFQSAAEQIEKSRMELVQKYGEPNEDGQTYRITEGNEEAANKEFTELMNVEDNIDIMQVDINTLNDSVELTNGQMEAIMFMLKDGDKVEEA